MVEMKKCDCGCGQLCRVTSNTCRGHAKRCDPTLAAKNGEKFGLLTVVKCDGFEKSRLMAIVACDCGNTLRVRVNGLRTGITTSCGCKRTKSLQQRNTNHGFAPRSGRHYLYRTWANIIQRCTNINNPKYKDYGGRGIAVCDAWLHSFVAFVSDVGERPFPGAEIDRIDNNGNYEPRNIRWATRKQQTNNSRANRVFSCYGKTQNLTAWANELGWSFMGLKNRLKRMPIKSALVRKTVA